MLALRRQQPEPSQVSRAFLGSRADIHVHTYPDGSFAIRKDFGSRGFARSAAERRELDSLADRELLAPQIVEAVGGRSAAVIKTGDREVLIQWVDGDTWAEIGGWGWDSDPAIVARFRAIADSDEGRLLGLADYLMGNTDRHGGNWKYVNGKITAIDHDYGFQSLAGTKVPPGDFTEYLLASTTDGTYALARKIDVNPADLAIIRRRLEALRPRFAQVGREAWINGVLRRLAAVEKRADPGAKVRLA